MAIRSAVVTVMAQAAYKAARRLVRDFGEVENLQVSKKGPADFVTAADLHAEKILRAELGRARPDFGFLLEESGAHSGKDERRRWIVDPLDGTVNFLHGIPQFCISIALEEHGTITAGVIYDPLRDELYRAERGGGAYLNDRRLRVSARGKLAESMIATGIPWKGREQHPQYLAQLAAVMTECVGVRRMGAAALDLAFVAAGRFEGFWEPALAPWDLAAGVLLVREAGGFVSDFEGRDDPLETGNVIAANDRLHGELLALLRTAWRS